MARVVGSDPAADPLAGALAVDGDEQPAAALTKTHPAAIAPRAELKIPRL
jgi:hypothetical protein